MTMFLNTYQCPGCKTVWHDEWDAMCDDDCPECGMRHISPMESEDISEAEDDQTVQTAVSA